MKTKTADSKWIEDTWYKFLTTGGDEAEQRKRYLFRLLPGSHRCKFCLAPFQGAGSYIARAFFKVRQSNLNPFMCDACDNFAREYLGGIEIELSLLFADVRGSTKIAENMSPAEFHKLINRFYSVTTKVMAKSGALIDKIIGDQASGMYAPGIAGEQHAEKAIQAARDILIETGHSQPDGPWIPLGIGVHTGKAFVGSVGSQSGTSDITVLGDAANTAARLSSSAGIGEIFVSESAFDHAGYSHAENQEQRELTLKGKSNSILINVFTLNNNILKTT